MLRLSGRGIFRDAQSRRRRSDGIFNNFYISVKETSTGVNAFKILVSRNGGISPKPGPNMMWKRQVQSYGEHDGQVVCAERAKLRVASAGESKGAILSRPKKNALGTF